MAIKVIERDKEDTYCMTTGVPSHHFYVSGYPSAGCTSALPACVSPDDGEYT